MATPIKKLPFVVFLFFDRNAQCSISPFCRDEQDGTGGLYRNFAADASKEELLHVSSALASHNYERDAVFLYCLYYLDSGRTVFYNHVYFDLSHVLKQLFHAFKPCFVYPVEFFDPLIKMRAYFCCILDMEESHLPGIPGSDFKNFGKRDISVF